MEGLTALQRPSRVIDSFALTDGRCNLTHDGVHFPSLDKFRVVSILMDVAAWPEGVSPRKAPVYR